MRGLRHKKGREVKNELPARRANWDSNELPDQAYLSVLVVQKWVEVLRQKSKVKMIRSRGLVPRLQTHVHPRRSFAEAASNNLKGPVTWASLAITGAVGAAGVAYYSIEKDRLQTLVATKQKVVGKPSLGGPWTLVESDGKPVTDASLRGKFALLYFGFTRCPDICPSELVKVGNVLDRLGPEIAGSKLETLFLSVDPQRDFLSQLRAYGTDFHPTIRYLTGTKEQVAAATKAYRVYFIKANENETDEEEYLVDHSTVLYLVGPDGVFLDFFTSSVTAPDIAKRIKDYVDPAAAVETIGPAEVWRETLAKLGRLLRSSESK